MIIWVEKDGFVLVVSWGMMDQWELGLPEYSLFGTWLPIITRSCYNQIEEPRLPRILFSCPSVVPPHPNKGCSPPGGPPHLKLCNQSNQEMPLAENASAGRWVCSCWSRGVGSLLVWEFVLLCGCGYYLLGRECAPSLSGREKGMMGRLATYRDVRKEKR